MSLVNHWATIGKSQVALFSSNNVFLEIFDSDLAVKGELVKETMRETLHAEINTLEPIIQEKLMCHLITTLCCATDYHV